MNLLVTNTRNPQAYHIIRSLRPHAGKIVATVYGPNWLTARLSHAALSRYVDRRYRVPDPTGDWRNGNIRRENAEREEEYILSVLNICNREAIDVIFPSWDPHVYLFAKNKERFTRRGILVPVPSYEVIVRLMDKYTVIRDAQKKGIPCPKTFLLAGQDDLNVIGSDLGFPLVIKPRFSSGSQGLFIVRTADDLRAKLEAVRVKYGWPIVQEYIPGRTQVSAMMLIDPKGNTKELFCERAHRSLCGRLTVEESIPPFPEAAKLAAFLTELGYCGPVFAQMKVDPRDALPKLLEVNVRVSAGVWTEIAAGIDIPWLSLKIAEGEEIGVQTYQPGVKEVCVFDDSLGLAVFVLMKLLGKSWYETQDSVPTLRGRIQAYWATYTAKDKVLDPYFRYFLQTPVVSLAYLGQLLQVVWRNRRNLRLM
jgi:biotin carboxylase